MDLSRNKAIYHFRITKRDDKTEEMVNRFKRDTSSISIRLRSEDLKNDFTQVHNLSDIIEEFESRYDGYDMNMSQLMDEVEEIIKSTEQIKGGKKIGTKIPKLPLTQLRKISSCKKYPDIHRMNTQLLKPRSDSVMRSTQRSISKIIESHRNIVESSPFWTKGFTKRNPSYQNLTERIKSKFTDDKNQPDSISSLEKVKSSRSAFDLISNFNRNGISRSDQLDYFNRPQIAIPSINSTLLKCNNNSIEKDHQKHIKSIKEISQDSGDQTELSGW